MEEISEEKCCTKKQDCDNTPKCVKKRDIKELIGYLIVFNLMIVIFRILVITKEETAQIGEGWLAHIVWYTKFILFLQLQMFAIYVLYEMTVKTFQNLVKCLKNMFMALQEFLGVVKPNAFMEWLHMSKAYWWIRKIICLLLILWNIFCIFVILGGYLFVVFLFGPYLLGYYSIYG